MSTTWPFSADGAQPIKNRMGLSPVVKESMLVTVMLPTPSRHQNFSAYMLSFSPGTHEKVLQVIYKSNSGCPKVWDKDTEYTPVNTVGYYLINSSP